MKWPYKVMWNKYGKYEQVRSFKDIDVALEWIREHPELKASLYIHFDWCLAP